MNNISTHVCVTTKLVPKRRQNVYCQYMMILKQVHKEVFWVAISKKATQQKKQTIITQNGKGKEVKSLLLCK